MTDNTFAFQAVVAVVAAVGFVSLVRQAIAALRRPVKDPQRLFDNNQKSIGRRRAGNQCEHKHPFWRRCSGGAEEADHIYPHSRGGLTSIGNLQYLCKRHNGRKSAWVPTRTYIWRLERRRRKYFPEGEDPTVNWRTPPGSSPATGSSSRSRRRNTDRGVATDFYVGITTTGDNDGEPVETQR